MPEGLRGRSTETKYARIPLWLFETGVSLQAIATYAWLHGRYGHYERTIPGYKKLAADLGVAKSTVIDHVRELKAVGALVVQPRFDGGRQTTNEYVIAFNEPFHTEGGRHSDPGGQQGDPRGRHSDPGGQHTDPRGSAHATPEEDVEEEDEEKKTETYTQTRLTPGGEPDTEPDPHQPKPPEPGSDDDPQFCAWWAQYPKKVSKGQARRAWRAAIKKASFDELMAGLENYKRSPDVDRGYVRNPATWLNGEAWADDFVSVAENEAKTRKVHQPHRNPTSFGDDPDPWADPWADGTNEGSPA